MKVEERLNEIGENVMLDIIRYKLDITKDEAKRKLEDMFNFLAEELESYNKVKRKDIENNINKRYSKIKDKREYKTFVHIMNTLLKTTGENVENNSASLIASRVRDEWRSVKIEEISKYWYKYLTMPFTKSSKEKLNKYCTICGSSKAVFFPKPLNKLNTTDYTSTIEELKRTKGICVKCYIKQIFSNYAPIVTEDIKPLDNYSSRVGNILVTILPWKSDITSGIYMENPLFRVIINYATEKDNAKRDNIIIWQEGSRSDNSNIIASGEINNVNLLLRILKKDRDVIEKLKQEMFKNIPRIIKENNGELTNYFTYCVDFFQSGRINDELLMILLKYVMASDRSENFYTKRWVYKFIARYLEVKNMDKEVVEFGRRMGRLLIEYTSDVNLEAVRKWAKANAVQMLISPTTFKKGIFDIQVKLASTNANNYYMRKELENVDNIAKSRSSRLSFLIGFLWGIANASRQARETGGE